MDAKTMVGGFVSGLGPVICAIFINGALERRSVPVDARALACAAAAGLICLGRRLVLRVNAENLVRARLVPLFIAFIVMTGVLGTNLVGHRW